MLHEITLNYWIIHGGRERGRGIFLPSTGKLGIIMMDWRVRREC